MDSRPNILFITADQWRGDCLGFAGHPVVRTPHLDALAADGVACLNHFSACAPCSPARASLYAGLYQFNHRVVGNGTPLDARFDNVALAARRAGYRPTLFGYTDTALDPRNRPQNDPELRSYEEVLPGFELGTNLREDDMAWLEWCAEMGIDVHPENPHAVGSDGHRIATGPTRYKAGETQTTFLVERFLEWETTQTEPWFAHLSFLRPHPPFVAPSPYNAMFSPAQVPRSIGDGADAFASAHPFVQLLRAHSSLAGLVPSTEGTVADLTEDDFARLRAVYFGMIAEVDAELGGLFATLKSRAVWDDTLIVFTSDHGEMMGDHGLMSKGGFYPQSQHIPLIIRDPARKGGLVTEGFTSSVDVFPTLCARIGVTPGHAVDGQDLFQGDNIQTRDHALWEYDFRVDLHKQGLSNLPLRQQDCTLLVRRTAQEQYVHTAAFEPLLFDLCQDPDCLTPIDDPLRKGQAAQALLSERMARNDQTLATIVLTKNGPLSLLP
ncbi:MAG: sulfatase-like hydrolase/transferase [Pseudomonadota bacterium]